MVLGIYGSGGLGREVLDTVKLINSTAPTWDKVVFLNDFPDKQVVNGTEVLTLDKFCSSFPTDSGEVVIAVGEPEIREILANKVISRGYRLCTVIHPVAFIGTDAKIGAGAVICYGAFISCNTNIGENSLIQPHSCVGHDSVVGDHSVISEFVAISGYVTIGVKTYIGISVPIKQEVNIGSQSVVGMGSVVVRDIPDNVIALGNPARVMKKNEEHSVFK